MIKNIYITSLVILILLSSTLPVHSDQTEYQNFVGRIDTINQLINQASNANSLWRETKKLSDSAKKYAYAENYTLANETLIEAEFQAKLGIQQALDGTDKLSASE
jgi:hypothetical protein